MAYKSNIGWTDGTFNPWIGCQKAGEGCDNCYAAAFNHRLGQTDFEKGSKPRLLSDGNWQKPISWNKKASAAGERYLVFAGSMCDWADKNADDEVRARFWELIRATPMIQWQLLTKRAPNIAKYLPEDWGNGYKNVSLGVTVENKRQGLRRMDMLKEIPASVRFVSVEPLLEPLGKINLTGIDWVIVGGESGAKARPMQVAWVDEVYQASLEHECPFFFKQWGTYGEDGVRRSVKENGELYRGREIKQFPRSYGLNAYSTARELGN
jgi:protein gp37